MCVCMFCFVFFVVVFFFQAEDGIRDIGVTGVQTCALPISIGEAAIQTHGGVGMTDELSVSHYHKRLIAYDAQLGDHRYHLRTVGMG